MIETSSAKETANPNRQPLRILQCRGCGTGFRPTHWKQAYCSRVCWTRFYQQKNRTKFIARSRAWYAAQHQYVNADELEECLEDPRKARTIAGPDVIVCLECGVKLKELGDHVKKKHGMTMAEYKRKPPPGGQIPRYSRRSSLTSTNLYRFRSEKWKSLGTVDSLAGRHPPTQRLIKSRGPWKVSLERRLNLRDAQQGKGRPDLWKKTPEGEVVTDASIAKLRLDGMKGKDIAQCVGIKGRYDAIYTRLHRMGFPPGLPCLFRYGEPITSRHILDLCSDFGMMQKEMAEELRVNYNMLTYHTAASRDDNKPLPVWWADRVLDVRPKLAEQYHQATKKRGRRPRTFPSEEISICASYKKLKDDLKVLQKWLEQKGKDVPMSMVWTWLCERSRDRTIRLLFWPEFLEWITTDSDHAKLNYASPHVLAKQLLAKTRDVSEGKIKSILKEGSPKQQDKIRPLEDSFTILAGAKAISTKDLVAALKKSGHSSYKDLTPIRLAQKLRLAGVKRKSPTVRLPGGRVAKGYTRKDLELALP